MAVIHKPHVVTVYLPKRTVVNGVVTSEGYDEAGARIMCNVQPKTSDSAYRDYNIENEEVMELFADTKYQRFFIDGAKVKKGGSEFVVKGNAMVFDQDLPNDHLRCALVRIKTS